MRLIPRSLSLIWALSLAGCAASPTAKQITAAVPVKESEEYQGVIQASHEVEVTEFSPVGRRSFPQQGWWCSEFDEWLTAERLDKGYTLVLPGVEGTSWFNISIARGLADAGHDAAIEVVDWTTGNWVLFPYHLMALERNKQRAKEIADRIIAYQKCYPDRPVRIVGHSGGAAMAVLVLEALPENHLVENAVLLAAAISPDHDLCPALDRTNQGITNFYSGGDAVYLVAGTLALGTIDREHKASAGAVGFREPAGMPEWIRDGFSKDGRGVLLNLADSAITALRRKNYEKKLHQIAYRPEMLKSLNLGGHFGPVNRKFVTEWVAPRLIATNTSNEEKKGEGTLITTDKR